MDVFASDYAKIAFAKPQPEVSIVLRVCPIIAYRVVGFSQQADAL